jgi:predicted RNA-binding Zn-ribbon protein involved in translation (DUF1610 family)
MSAPQRVYSGQHPFPGPSYEQGDFNDEVSSMRCATCGRELNDLALATGSCPSCGAPIAAAPPPAPAPEPVIVAVIEEEPEIDPSSSAVMAFCANCGRPLTASAIAAGTCPSCGAPVSLEAPVPPPEPMVAATTVVEAESVTTTEDGVTESSAMLAADSVVVTPDSVTETTVMASESVVFTESPAAPPTPAAAPEPPVAAAPPVVAAPPAPTMPAPAGTPPTAQSQRGVTGAVILGIVAAIVVLGLLILYLLGRNGTGPFASVAPTAVPTATATSIPTATPIPTPAVSAPAAGFQTFIAPDNSYGLNYPSAWTSTAQTVNGTTGQIAFQLFVSPDGQDILLTLPLTSQVPAAQYPTLIQAFVGSLATGSSNIMVDPTTTTVTVGTRSWNEATGTLTYKNVPYKAIVLGTDHGTPATTFVIVELAPAATFASVETADFMPMAASVAFSS